MITHLLCQDSEELSYRPAELEACHWVFSEYDRIPTSSHAEVQRTWSQDTAISKSLAQKCDRLRVSDDELREQHRVLLKTMNSDGIDSVKLTQCRLKLVGHCENLPIDPITLFSSNEVIFRCLGRCSCSFA